MKLLTLDSLYSYYEKQNKNVKFSASDDNTNIIVQVPANIINFKKKTDNEPNHKELLTPVTLQACHTLENVNKSYISEEAMLAALPSFSNRPILGYIHDVDGKPEFYTHNMHVEENEDGEETIVYDEIPIGIIPESCNARLEYDKEKDKTYVVVDGYIFDDYTKAREILSREEQLSVSVELSIRSLSYDAKSKHLSIDDFFFMGVTILGKTPDGDIVKPGMTGSNIKLADFSKEENSLLGKVDTNKLFELLSSINTKLDNFNINSNNEDEKSKEGGTIQSTMTKFEELLQKYNKTVEDVTFEYEGLSDDELEAVFAEHFGEAEPSNDPEPEPTEPEPNDNPEGEGDGDPVEPDDNEPSEPEPEPTVEQNSLKYSVTLGDKTKEFALSLSEIQSALYNLVNDTYSDADNTWYGVNVYDDGTVVMEDYWNGKYYKQAYERTDDNFALKGDREEVFVSFLTASEQEALAELKSNYALATEKLAKYESAELEANKIELLNSADYSSISVKDENGEYKFAEYKELADNHTDFSLDELKSKLDDVILTYAKKGQLNFAQTSTDEPTPKKSVGYTRLPISTGKSAKKSRYGNIFAKEN